MAIYEPGAGLDPFRGLDLGTVFQRGKYAPVIKSGSKTQGQRLAPFQDQKAAWYRALQLWKELLPFEKANWDAARPDFPTTDRFGNTVLSSARDLFLRTIARLPIEDQKPLNTPRAAYTGTTPADPDLQLNSGALEFTVPAVPAGEQFGYSLFMTIQRPLSTDYAKTSYRRIAFDDDYSAGATIDVTAQYEDLFGALQSYVRIFWCAEIVNTDTPEVLSSACGSVEVPNLNVYTVPVGNGLYVLQQPEWVFGPALSGAQYVPNVPFSVQCIFRPMGPGSDGDFNGNAIYYSSITGTSGRNGIAVLHRNDGKIICGIVRGSSLRMRVLGNTVLNNNQVYHITFTYSGNGFGYNEWNLYIDGVLEPAVKSNSPPTNTIANAQYQIGARTSGSFFPRRVNGMIYDILQLHDYELSASEVATLAAGTLPDLAVPFIVRRFSFEQDQGNTVPELQNSLNATMSGFGTRSNLGGGAWRNAAGGIAP